MWPIIQTPIADGGAVGAIPDKWTVVQCPSRALPGGRGWQKMAFIGAMMEVRGTIHARKSEILWTF
jgi:hypothetical protein